MTKSAHVLTNFQNMNSEFCKEDDPESNSENLEMSDLIAATDEPLSITKGTT